MGKESRDTAAYLMKKVSEAKIHFERAVECKHTEFDDLYPYMVEHPQFFWYKRYVAWSELLTVIDICDHLGLEWKDQFTPKQIEYIQKRIMSSKVLDEWFEIEHVGGN